MKRTMRAVKENVAAMNIIFVRVHNKCKQDRTRDRVEGERLTEREGRQRLTRDDCVKGTWERSGERSRAGGVSGDGWRKWQ